MRKNKIFVFLFASSSLFLLIFIPNVAAATLTNSSLHVSLDLEEENGIRWTAGEGRLNKIIPTGSEIVVVDGVSYRKISAKAFYDLATVIWTYGAVLDCVNYEKISQSFTWLELWTSRDPNWPWYPITKENYTVNYDTYNLISSNVPGLNRRVNIDVSLESNIPSELDFGSFKVGINTKQFVSTPAQIVVLDSQAQDISKYNTYATAQGETSISAQDISEANANAAASTCGDATSDISFYLDQLNLGVTRLAQNQGTFQQGTNTPAVVGSDDVLERGLVVNIAPNIMKIDELLKIRSKFLVVDTYTEWFGINPAGVSGQSHSVVEDTIARTIAWTVQHKAVKANLRVEFDIFALTDLVTITEPGKPDLVIPETQYDDMYWANYLTGNTGVTIDTSDEDPFAQWLGSLWGNYQTIFIVIIIIVAIVGFIFLKSKFGGSGGSRTTKFNINFGKQGSQNDKE